eukprot:6202023-Pyramimonas_sp.AAC.1
MSNVSNHLFARCQFPGLERRGFARPLIIPDIAWRGRQGDARANVECAGTIASTTGWPAGVSRSALSCASAPAHSLHVIDCFGASGL